MHFRHISANIQPKNQKHVQYLVLSSARQHSIGEGTGPLGLALVFLLTPGS